MRYVGMFLESKSNFAKYYNDTMFNILTNCCKICIIFNQQENELKDPFASFYVLHVQRYVIWVIYKFS